MRRIIVSGVAIALASCSADPAPQNEATGNDFAATATQNSVEPAAGAQMPEAPAPEPGGNSASEPDGNATSKPEPAAVIPAALRGRWGLVPADCTSTKGDAKGLMTVSDTQLRFYESRGTLAKIEKSDPTRIEADFDFTGEGQTWKRRMILDGQDKGRTLIRREYGQDAMPGPLRYSKCSA